MTNRMDGAIVENRKKPFVPSVGHADHIYLSMIGRIWREGAVREDRTNVGTKSIFGDINMKFDLREGFPLLTTKRVHMHSIIHELLWMLMGDSNIRYLKANKVSIWDEWVDQKTAEYKTLSFEERLNIMKPWQKVGVQKIADECEDDEAFREMVERKMDVWNVPSQILIAGELGPVYGAQWRRWKDTRFVEEHEFESRMYDFAEKGYSVIGKVSNTDSNVRGVLIHREIDQIANIEEALRLNPFSRRIILNGWNVSYVEEMALPPCHTLAQWYVEEDEKTGERFLDCKLYMRSNDIFLGCPFNIAQYALMTIMLATVHGMTPRYYYHSIGDAHIYMNHDSAVREQLSRPILHKMPTLKINGEHKSILDIRYEDIELIGYEHQPAISAPVAV